MPDTQHDNILNTNLELHTQEHRILNLSSEIADHANQIDNPSKDKLYNWFATLDDIAREIHMIREGMGT